ncbi:hypothetical protein [Streptomyces hirsutus]|uniref:hypothetical protein n=1 Tax=Streptomyces hirsutus TaxID=35620 RepID=UPI0036A31BD0
MRFEEYAAHGKAGQRNPGPASGVHLDSLLNIHLLPLLGSRRMNTSDREAVEDFLLSMERNGVGLAAQANAFDKPKASLLDAHRLGLFDEDPVACIQPPRYDPKRVVLPSPGQLRRIRAAGDDSFRLAGRGPDERMRHAQRRGIRRQPQQHRRRRRLPHRRTGRPHHLPLRAAQAPQAR